MNKCEVISFLSEKNKLSKTKCKCILDDFFILIQKNTLEGKETFFKSFGKFSHKVIKPHKKYIPYLQQYINFPQKIIPIFKPSKNFKGKFI